MNLRVNEIFQSISGEAGGFLQGTWCTFVRFQGCHFRCAWCDTPNALSTSGGVEMSLDEIKQHIYISHTKHVLLTGGEPLLQDNVIGLMEELLAQGYSIQVETGDIMLIPKISAHFGYLCWVVDYKTPSSRMEGRMLPIADFARKIGEIEGRNQPVYVKWVISGEEDLEFAIPRIQSLKRSGYLTPQLISPCFHKGDGVEDISEIVEMLEEKNLLNDVVFSYQLHKLLKMP